MNVIKIFVAMHTSSMISRHPLLYPVQTGSALSETRLDMLYDDEGQNISEKNPMYCELTAHYWMWKNVMADYYGLFHYRRYFSFNPEILGVPKTEGIVFFDYLDKAAAEKLYLTEDRMREVIESHDVIAPMPVILNESVYDHYKNSPNHHIKDLETIQEIIREKYPQFVPYMQQHLSSKKAYFTNMFIMKKEIFHEYSQWLFDILFEFEKRTDLSHYSVAEYRVAGYLGERLFGIYYHYLKSRGSLKVMELERSHFWNTNYETSISPAYDNAVTLILACNDFYTLYTSVLLESLKAHASENVNYDMIIMNRDISVRNKKLLKKIFEGRENFSLRFFDISYYADQYKNLFVSNHLSEETYFRLFLPDILKEYKKAIYLDCDMIILDDLKKLYDCDLKGAALGGVADINMIMMYDARKAAYDKQCFKTYIDNELKLPNPYRYINAGMLLMDLEKWREKNARRNFISYAAERSYLYHDQDILNCIFNEDICLLPMRWNMFWASGLALKSQNTEKLVDDYLKEADAPGIVHYVWVNKPWDVPELPNAEHFWYYARKSDYYEALILRMAINNSSLSRSKRSLFKDLLFPEQSIRRKMIQFLFPAESKRREFLLKLIKR